MGGLRQWLTWMMKTWWRFSSRLIDPSYSLLREYVSVPLFTAISFVLFPSNLAWFQRSGAVVDGEKCLLMSHRLE